MPEARPNPGEVPQTGASPAANHNAEVKERARRQAKPYMETARKPQMAAAGEKIGSAVGSAVDAVKGVQRRLQSVPEQVSSAKQKISEQIAERSGQLRRSLSSATEGWKQSAGNRAERARTRAAEYARQRPFHVIAALAALAFAAGAGLRIWRCRRA